MRVKAVPRQYQVQNVFEKIRENETIFDTSRISKSEPCLCFDEDFETMHHNAAVEQVLGPEIDEALDLAMPTRSRCKHECYSSCLSLIEDLSKYTCEEQIEAIDLSTKNRRDNVLEASKERNEYKDTFLYKMLTDSKFLDDLRKNNEATGHDCPFCKQNFTREDDLANHLNVQKDETNQVACCACGKTFAQKRYLRYHQRCHSERNKYTCDICTKNYSRLDNLTRHNNFHTNPDKFPCTYCDRTFARKDLLKKHLKSHENRHRYHCSICDKYFKGPLSLENHKKLFHSNT